MPIRVASTGAQSTRCSHSQAQPIFCARYARRNKSNATVHDLFIFTAKRRHGRRSLVCVRACGKAAKKRRFWGLSQNRHVLGLRYEARIGLWSISKRRFPDPHTVSSPSLIPAKQKTALRNRELCTERHADRSGNDTHV